MRWNIPRPPCCLLTYGPSGQDSSVVQGQATPGGRIDRLVRVVERFEKDPSDAFVDECELTDTQLSDLQRLWDIPPDNPMFDCYPVGEAQRAYVEAHSEVTLDFDRFDYFVACYTLPKQKSPADVDVKG